MPALRLGNTAPDFSAETTAGPIKFHDWIGDSWVDMPSWSQLLGSSRLPYRLSSFRTLVTLLLSARRSLEKSLDELMTLRNETLKLSVSRLTGCKITTNGSRILMSSVQSLDPLTSNFLLWARICYRCRIDVDVIHSHSRSPMKTGRFQPSTTCWTNRMPQTEMPKAFPLPWVYHRKSCQLRLLNRIFISDSNGLRNRPQENY